MRSPVAREGLPLILIGIVLTLVAVWWARSGGWGARGLAPALCGALGFFVVYFFRDPERRIPERNDLVVAPADGRIVSVGLVDGEELMAGPATRVTIFLSVFDVHVQRAPLAGRVVHFSHSEGVYLPAWRNDASSRNESATLGFETAAGPVVVRQIAGFIARRIATYPREGDHVAKGERIGLIRFGSRVDLFVPGEWDVPVEPGDMVRGGESVMAWVTREGGTGEDGAAPRSARESADR